MYILDTDHISILDRGGINAQNLLNRLANIHPEEVVVTIISYEEQTRGWLSHIAKVRTLESQVEIYKQPKRQIENYCAIPIVEFDIKAAHEFQRLRKSYPRLGAMDLKIAAIAIVNNAIILTRNISDFGQISNLRIEDWTV
ncbi:type II toxin-antitoxin system VapC family toxin [Tumidithrix elongata RA019]|uniref:Type II toxin-antitoxin system VapC family toxin n=1 Tax=Tumidithrix elongata BACA0141 TaxID=2716417 RepID=A0AAW9PNT9_9CYAN|nr:type II toxin-antitoxin system VapC family toxin [Tumidithrix elongata RA019]